MSWAKLSDDYSDDCWTLSDAAFRLHTEALVWSARKLLDCVIPKPDLRRFAKNIEALQELLDTGFWQEQGDNYVIRHHSMYQRLREDVVAQQEANKANGRKGGRPRRAGREDVPSAKTNLDSNSPSNALCKQDAPIDVDPDAWTAADWEKPEVKARTKTQLLTETETKRDRTGQDRPLQETQRNVVSLSSIRNFPDCSTPGCDGQLNQGQVSKGSSVCQNCDRLAGAV